MTTTTVTQAVQKREAGPVSVMFSSKKQFAAVLPRSVDVEAFLGTMAGALYASKDLMRAAQSSPDSLYTALMRCAALGHMPGTDEFYLTPRKDKGVPKVLGIEGYRGVIERMYRSGAVAKVVVREVCAQDEFRYVEGVDDKPVHAFGGTGTGSTGADFFGSQGTRDRGMMVGVYAYAELVTGAVSRVVLLDRDDVHAARDAGGYKPDDPYTPWNRFDAGKDHPELRGRSMWWKTAAKRLEPWVPTSAEYRRELLRASAAAAAEPPPMSHWTAEATRARGEVPGTYPDGTAPEPVYEAEVVDDRHEPAQDGTQASRPAPASAQSVRKLADTLARLPLGTNDDVAALLEWITGHPVASLGDLTRTEVRDVTAMLGSHLQAAQGDTSVAASNLWQQHKAATGGSGE